MEIGGQMVDAADNSDSSQIELIGQLMSSQVFAEEGLEAALRETAKIGVHLLDVDRISIWLLESNEIEVNCTVAYNRGDGSFQSGTLSDITARSDYLDMLKRRHVIAVEDTRSDPNVDAIRDKFLTPLNIRALMDGVIHQDDKFMGSVIASQFNSTRKWKSEEIAYMGVICQSIANLLERSSRQTAEIRLRDWVDTSTVSQWQMNADLIYTGIDAHSAASWGVTEKRFIGKTRWDAAGASLEDPEWQAHYETLQSRLPFRNFVYSMDTPNEGQKIVSISGNPIFDSQNNFLGYRGTTNDVTNVVGVEIALEETEQRFKDLVAGSLQGVGIMVNDLVVFANDAFAKAFGYEGDEVIGMRKTDFVAKQDQVQRAEYRKNQTEGSQEMRGITKSGETRQFEAFATNMIWMGSPARLLTLIDITEKRIAEEHLRHAQKMEAVGELTGGIAHDFNNLLSVIMGNAELLTDKVTKIDDKADANLANIMRAAQGGAELTRRLLAFARRQPLQAEQTDIKHLIEGLRSMFGHTLGEAIQPKMLFEHELPLVLVDQAQLENVLLNLAINARDAMPEGGTFTIICKNHIEEEGDPDQPEQLESDEGLKPGSYVKIDVRDSGSGISPEIIDRIFDPFFTTKEVGKGTGLGLSMVFGFVRQSGGQIAVSSPPGRGTTISIWLPAAMQA
jgi:PAS domain S-box-containing protein